MRRALPVIVVAVLVAVVVVGLVQSGGSAPEDTADRPRFDLRRSLAALADAPAPLAALHADSSRLLDGGVAGFETRLKELRGYGVVVNKWASWCAPCRTEFPHFQRLSARRGDRIAFLGVNSGDNRDDAAEFLTEFPTPFPSYVDPDEKIARAIGAPANYPVTVFFDAQGKRAFVHQGQYRTEADLAADIDRYLG